MQLSQITVACPQSWEEERREKTSSVLYPKVRSSEGSGALYSFKSIKKLDNMNPEVGAKKAIYLGSEHWLRRIRLTGSSRSVTTKYVSFDEKEFSLSSTTTENWTVKLEQESTARAENQSVHQTVTLKRILNDETGSVEQEVNCGQDNTEGLNHQEKNSTGKASVPLGRSTRIRNEPNW